MHFTTKGNYYKKDCIAIRTALSLIGMSACTAKENNPPEASPQPQEPSGSVTIYPTPSCYEISELISVSVNGNDVAIIKNQDQYDYCSFAFTGMVTVSVTATEAIETW